MFENPTEWSDFVKRRRTKGIIRGPMGRQIDLAEVEAKRIETARLEAMPEDDADRSLYTEADAFLDSDPQIAALVDTIETGAGLVTLGTVAIKKATKEQHLAAIARAYAFWIKSSRNRAYKSFYREAFAKRKKYNPKTTKLHLVVESLISYGDENEGKDYKLHNRDVQAIRWLNHNRISPRDVLQLSATKSEGLDTWARRWAKEAKNLLAAENCESGKLINTAAEDVPNLAQQNTRNTGNIEGEYNLGPEGPVIISWIDYRDGSSRTLKLYTTPGAERKIDDCLNVLQAIDVKARTFPMLE